MKCSRSDCTAEAAWHVLMEIAAPAPSDGKATGATVLVVCTPHSKGATFEDVMTDDGWEQLCQAFASAGKARPDRARCRLLFEAMQ